MHHPIRRLPAASLAMALLLATGAGLVTARPVAADDFLAYDSDYHTYPEMVDEIKSTEAAYPDIVALRSIGSKLARPDHLGSQGVGSGRDRRARARGPVRSAPPRARAPVARAELAVLRWLTAGYGSDERVTKIVDTREIWIVFAVNPDGAQYDLTGSPYRAWRKNRQPNPGSTAIGTDLNRNYGYHWACCNGSSGAVGLDVPWPERVLGAGDPCHARLHGQPPDRRPAADQDGHHIPHGRRADPLAVRLHQGQRAGT